MKKLSFTVENAEMIQENPDSKFAVLSLDFFASGDNLHDLYVSEETLFRTADTIKGCPLVWKYDEILDDVYTHDPGEVPCGFVSENALITNKPLEDGRTMLSVIAIVWKRYTGELLNFFKRDGGKKPISVEMSVYKTHSKDDGKTELLDFGYEGITILGSFVTPAIPMARATILSFAEEYEEDLEREFSFTEIIIPSKIRNNAEKGLDVRKEQGGGTSTGVAFARYLTKNRIITPEKVREIANYFSTHKNSNETIDWLLWGGDYAREWAEKTLEKIDNKGNIIKASADVQDAVNFTDKEITMTEEEKMAAEKAEADAKMAADEEEKAKAAEEAKKKLEEEKGKEKKFEFPIEKMEEMFSDDDDEDDVKMAKVECAKGKEADFGIVMAGAYAKMCKMQAYAKKLAEDNKAYMAENEELKKFKAELETKQKEFAVNETLKEVSEAVYIPDNVMAEMKAEADKYAFESIEAWKNYVKAKSFEFAIKPIKDNGITEVGLPFGSVTVQKDDLWATQPNSIIK